MVGPVRPTCPTSSSSAPSAAAGTSARRSAYSIIVVIASIIIANFALRVLSSLLEVRRSYDPHSTESERSARRDRDGARLRSASSPGWWRPSSSSRSSGWCSTGSRTEPDANASPKLFFEPTLDRFRDVTEADTGAARLHRGLLATRSGSSSSRRCWCWLLAIPAAYCARRSARCKKWRDVLFFFISTKFLPIVAAILPLWIIAESSGCSTRSLVLIILYTAMNLPLAVWMLRSFFPEVPRNSSRRPRSTGRTVRARSSTVMLPIVAPASRPRRCSASSSPGTSSSSPCSSTRSNASTVPDLGHVQRQHARATSSPSCRRRRPWPSFPVVVAGWIAQKRMIRGLAMGAIK